jgi:hypothetical protein
VGGADTRAQSLSTQVLVMQPAGQHAGQHALNGDAMITNRGTNRGTLKRFDIDLLLIYSTVLYINNCTMYFVNGDVSVSSQLAALS